MVGRRRWRQKWEAVRARRAHRSHRARTPQWIAFERRLADGSITDAVIRLANGEEVTVARGTPVLIGPGDAIVWRECHGWGWTTGGSEPEP